MDFGKYWKLPCHVDFNCMFMLLKMRYENDMRGSPCFQFDFNDV